MVMDYRRSCGSETWKLFRDSDRTTTVTWYWAEPGAKLFKGETPFRDGIYDNGDPTHWNQLGQVPGSPVVFTSGINTHGYKGECFIGTPDQWRNGLKLSDLDNPTAGPECCRDSRDVVCLKICLPDQDGFIGAFSCSGDFDVVFIPAGSIIVPCAGATALPTTLYATFVDVGLGECDCFAGEYELTYSSWTIWDVDGNPLSIDGWGLDYVNCGFDNERMLMWCDGSSEWHLYSWFLDSPDFPVVNFGYTQLADLTGLPDFTQGLVDASPKCGGVTGSMNVMLSVASSSIKAKFSVGGSLAYLFNMHLEGYFSCGGMLTPSYGFGISIEADFSAGGNMPGVYSNPGRVDITGSFSQGGELSPSVAYSQVIDGSFSASGDLAQS